VKGVIVISNKHARLKPCLRCGYSLRHIAGARNCPECGLAARISLSGNSGLEWTNPRWQRFLALALCVLALGMVCKVVGFATHWIIYAGAEGYFAMGHRLFALLAWLSQYPFELSPVLCGLAICLLAQGEQRYPDDSRPVRAMGLVTGILLIGVGLLNAVQFHEIWSFNSFLVRHILWETTYGPWVPLVLAIFTSTYAFHFGKRGHSKCLRQLSQLPLWPAVIAFFVWLLNFERLWWPLRSVVADAAFPLAMTVVLAVMIRVLLKGAREAAVNWVTEP